MKSAVCRIMLHEMRLVLREPKFLLPFLFPPVLLIASQLVLLPGVTSPEIVSRMMLLCSLLIAPMIVPLASDSFAGERERGSLELLLLLPVRPSAIFYGKLLALLPVPLFFVLFAETAYAWAADSWNFGFWWKSVLAGVLSSVLFSAVSLFVSLHTKTARAANQISLLFVFFFLMLSSVLSDIYFSCRLAPVVLFAVVAVLFGAVSSLSLSRFREL